MCYGYRMTRELRVDTVSLEYTTDSGDVRRELFVHTNLLGVKIFLDTIYKSSKETSIGMIQLNDEAADALEKFLRDTRKKRKAKK